MASLPRTGGGVTVFGLERQFESSPLGDAGALTVPRVLVHSPALAA